MTATQPTDEELRSAFNISGLWRDGWTLKRAKHTVSVFIGLRGTVAMMRRRQQQNGKPAPLQQALF